MWTTNEYGMTEFPWYLIKGMSKENLSFEKDRVRIVGHRNYHVRLHRDSHKFIEVTYNQFVKLLHGLDPFCNYGFHKSGKDIYFSV